MSATGGDPEALAASARRALLAARLRERIGASAAGPASAGQRALWFMHQLAPHGSALNIAFTAKILSAVDPSALRRAFQSLVDQHRTLRTVFPSESGVPLRRELSRLEVPFEHVDVSGQSDGELLAHVAQEIARPFDLAAGPLLRVALFTRHEDSAYLALSVHHIVLDGWSLWTCLSELGEHYSAIVAGRDVAEAPDEDFSRYVQLESEMVAGAAGTRHLDFWRARLADAPPLALHTDRRRPAIQAFQGALVRFRFGRDLTTRLRDMARDTRSTLHMVLLALFQALLHRYSGQGEITIGYMSSGRSQGTFDSVVGYMANPLPLRSALAADTTFIEFLRHTRDHVLEALEHEAYPFPLVVQHLAPQRDASRSPIFQTLFVFDKPQRLDDQGISAVVVGEPGVSMRLGALELESLPFPAQREGQFDLTLVATELDGDLAVALDYSTDLFDRATIERLAGHLRTLAESAVAAPQQLVAILPLLTPGEMATHGAPEAVDAPPLAFHEMVAQHVARQPDAPAVVFEGRSLSYSDLHRRARALARELGRHGVTVGTRVGLCAERSADLIVGVLGILEAGGAFVPLDPRYPEDRLAYMLSDAEVPVLVTERALAARLPTFSGEYVYLDSVTDEAGANVGDVARVGPGDLAYVIYTSGSTGRPKGVLLEHQGLVNVALEQQRMFGVGPGWRVLQFSSMSFDASVFEIAMALGSGATLYMARQEDLLPGPALVETIASNAITIVTLPPSALAGMPAADLPALRVITVAGEACGAELVGRWATGRAFFNLYGPTEATIWATAVRCVDSGTAPTIGCAIANAETYVLDEHLQRVPTGVPGELYLGGCGLARGYHRQPELTARAFVVNPHGRPGDRLYKTGDRVRCLATGELEFLGRIDTQVKVRGFRIELGEIETVLARHPDVEQAVAVVRGDPALGQIAAYVTPRAGRTPSGRELRAFLRTHLPEFMVPSFVTRLEAFPLSPAGKVDRHRLPAPQPEATEERVAPSRAHEAEVAAIWTDVLRVDHVGVDDNFFDCGGTSLLLARLHARLEQMAPGRFSVVDLFSLPTVKAQAARLRGEDGSANQQVSSHVDALVAGRERLRALATRRGAGSAAG